MLAQPESAHFGERGDIVHFEPICSGGGTVSSASASEYSLRTIPIDWKGFGHYAAYVEQRTGFAIPIQYARFCSLEIRVNDIITNGIKDFLESKSLGPRHKQKGWHMLDFAEGFGYPKCWYFDGRSRGVFVHWAALRQPVV